MGKLEGLTEISGKATLTEVFGMPKRKLLPANWPPEISFPTPEEMRVAAIEADKVLNQREKGSGRIRNKYRNPMHTPVTI